MNARQHLARVVGWGSLMMIAVAGFAFWPQSAHAAGVVGDGTPGSCTDATFQVAAAGGGKVTFACGAAPKTIEVSTWVVSATTTIDGGDSVTLDGRDLNQIFLVLGGGNLTLQDIQLARGNFSNGGAIFNATGGKVTLRGVDIYNSVADGGGNDGGAIYNRGTLAVNFSSFNGNQADDEGGAIYNDGGVVTIVGTNFSNNIANNAGILVPNGAGGAIASESGSLVLRRVLIRRNTAGSLGGGLYLKNTTVAITNTTVTDNLAGRENSGDAAQGGGMYLEGGSVSVLNGTIYRNRANSGGVFNNGATFTIKNTIVATNYADDGQSLTLNCDAAQATHATSAGHNIISDFSCFNPGSTGDQVNTDPLLGPLQANGGPTFSYLPTKNSTAINQGDNNGCPGHDQREVIRPIAIVCDIGATEVGQEMFLPSLKK
ncbi:MAG: hypothetical protein IPK16_16655 [Anaerolineales bacterium]|nr:hypothetical protein [Anaerolineales bacterium]